ncbi:hypothetical protein [Paludisphaera borealis]|uniref:Uncharacterized protein n=1 Tax=Paludisphaera borealis TaxID=1387353 RepID=A0A1U7CSX0_9BACT|nr:hypothetical protein [Paludisphaera borealis]APW62037.1 hypothetical protein BSF38_03569 [Paludisphaera borealis]MDR3620581.1 hypothetical protein [Paludisphaera borealis]
MPLPGTVRGWLVFGVGLGLAVLLSGCGDSEGGGSGRFVPNENKIEKINGMSPSEAYHKGDARRK